GRWRRVALWLIIWAAMSLLVGVAGVTAQLQQSPMLPEERFDWSNWYEVFFPGGFLASWVMVIWLVVAGAIKWIWRKWRRENVSNDSAKADDPATAPYPATAAP